MVWKRIQIKLNELFLEHQSLSWKSGQQLKYFKLYHVTPLFKDLKWTDFNSIFRMKEAALSFIYKNILVVADLNVKKIKYDLQNKVSLKITMNSDDYILIIKICFYIGRKAVEFDSDEYQKIK